MRLPNKKDLARKTVRLLPSIARLTRLVSFSLDMSEAYYINRSLACTLQADLDEILSGNSERPLTDTEKMVLSSLEKKLKEEIDKK